MRPNAESDAPARRAWPLVAGRSSSVAGYSANVAGYSANVARRASTISGTKSAPEIASA